MNLLGLQPQKNANKPSQNFKPNFESKNYFAEDLINENKIYEEIIVNFNNNLYCTSDNNDNLFSPENLSGDCYHHSAIFSPNNNFDFDFMNCNNENDFNSKDCNNNTYFDDYIKF